MLQTTVTQWHFMSTITIFNDNWIYSHIVSYCYEMFWVSEWVLCFLFHAILVCAPVLFSCCPAPHALSPHLLKHQSCSGAFYAFCVWCSAASETFRQGNVCYCIWSGVRPEPVQVQLRGKLIPDSLLWMRQHWGLIKTQRQLPDINSHWELPKQLCEFQRKSSSRGAGVFRWWAQRAPQGTPCRWSSSSVLIELEFMQDEVFFLWQMLGNRWQNTSSFWFSGRGPNLHE